MSIRNMMIGGAGASPPDAPTIGTATGGNASASVTFSAPAENGGSAGSYGNKGIKYGAADRNGGNATSSGSGGGGAGNNNATSGQESFSGGNGGPGLIGFWWQPLF